MLSFKLHVYIYTCLSHHLSVDIKVSVHSFISDDHGVVLTSYAQSLNGYSHVSMIPTEPGNVGDYSGTRPGVRMYISASPAACAVDYSNKEIYVFDENTGQLELFTNAGAQMNQTGTMKLKTVHSWLPRWGVQGK